jgi:5'-methylthioadenosine/S-adenosylhomocysteine nucleosidase
MDSGSCSGLINKIAAIICLILWANCTSARTGLICTLPNECDRVQDLVSLPTVQAVGGRKFVVGMIGRTEVVLVKSPMGKSQNAITTTVLLQQFAATRIISIGSAGSLTNDLPVGSVFTAKHVSAHDEGRYLNIGFVTYKGVRVAQQLNKSSRHGVTVYEGVLASGDQFIADSDRAKLVRELTGAHAVDTNSIAVKSACLAFGVKDCFFIRYISDSANNDSPAEFQNSTRANISDYIRFVIKVITLEEGV